MIRRLYLALAVLLGASLVALALTVAAGCTAAQMRFAAVVTGAASKLVCTGAVVALDLPGWSGTVCQEAAGLVAEALAAEASRRDALADAGADAGPVARVARPQASAMARAMAAEPEPARECVSVVSGGKVVGTACREVGR